MTVVLKKWDSAQRWRADISHGSNTSSLTGCINIDRLFQCQIDRIS